MHIVEGQEAQARAHSSAHAAAEPAPSIPGFHRQPTKSCTWRLVICMREVRWRHRPSTRAGLQEQPAAHVTRARPMPW